jgi:anti-sigma regulatory factor (Ser/Thr protein kinase)
MINATQRDVPQHGVNTVHLDLPSNYAYLNILDACITEILGHIDTLKEPGIIINDIRVAVQEACVYIIDRAYKGYPDKRITITLTLDEVSRTMVVEICDTGASFNLEVRTVPVSGLEGVDEDEYGLLLLHALMDEVCYTTHAETNLWRLTKHLA